MPHGTRLLVCSILLPYGWFPASCELECVYHFRSILVSAITRHCARNATHIGCTRASRKFSEQTSRFSKETSKATTSSSRQECWYDAAINCCMFEERSVRIQICSGHCAGRCVLISMRTRGLQCDENIRVKAASVRGIPRAEVP